MILKGFDPPLRPTVDEGILRSAIRNWMKSSEFFSDDNGIEEILLDIPVTYHSDGYEIAKHLDDQCCYDVDSNMVEELDGISNFVQTELNKSIKRWIEEYDIKPKLSVGTAVKFSRFVENENGRHIMKEVDGIIDGYYLEEAYYKIKDIDEEGSEPNLSRHLVTFEKIEGWV